MVLYPHPDTMLPTQTSAMIADNRGAMVVMVPLQLSFAMQAFRPNIGPKRAFRHGGSKIS
jgi:hypothetical protein